MKTVFNNIQPLIAYWTFFGIYIMLSYLETFSLQICAVIAFTIYVLLNILIGFNLNIKKIYWGIILLELQLFIGIICISLNETLPSFFTLFASFGNLFLALYSGDINNLNIIGCILSVLPPILSLGIGFGLARVKANKSVRL